MDSEFLTTWHTMGIAEREAALRLCDSEIVACVDFNMRMLWSAEIQARHCGVKGPVHPFDQNQLPFLSTMQFDGCLADNEKVYTCVRWPKEFIEDPSLLPSALKCATQGFGSRRVPKKLNPRQWCRLLQPPAKSWVDFERQLASLVEQLVLQEHSRRHSHSTEHTGGDEATGQQEPRYGGGNDTSVQSDEPAAEQPDDAEPGGTPAGAAVGTGSAARAAKRQRQRERRKMGKAIARTLQGGGAGQVSDAAGQAAVVAAAATLPGFQPSDAEDRPPDVTDGTPWKVEEVSIDAGVTDASAEPRMEQVARELLPCECLEICTESRMRQVAREEIAAQATPEQAQGGNVLDNLRDQIEKLRLDTVRRSQAARGSPITGIQAAPQDQVPAASHPGSMNGDAHVDGQDPRKVTPVLAPASAVEDGDEEGPDDAEEAVFAPPSYTPTQGGGRGKPIFAQSQDRWAGLHGRGMGRGRAMAPPPGLQGRGSRNASMPSSLAHNWNPVVRAIPEDEEEECSPACWPDHPELSAPDFWLPPPDSPDLVSCAESLRGALQIQTPSYWSQASYPASAVRTPAAHYAETPSPPMSPQLLAPSHPAVAPAMGVPPHLPSGVIPMYITVPLAIAQACPHCNKHFAMPPGSEANDNEASHEIKEMRLTLQERDARILELEQRLRDHGLPV